MLGFIAKSHKLCRMNFCLSMMASLVAPFFPSEVIHKGGTEFLSGAIISSFDGARFFLITSDWINYNDAIGARFMLIAGPFIAAWCLILFGLNGLTRAGTLFFVLATVVRVGAATGSAMYKVTSVSVRPVLFAGYLSLAFSLLRAAVTLGLIIGPAVGSVLYATGGFALPFYAIGVFSLALTAVQACITPDIKQLEKAAATTKNSAQQKAAGVVVDRKENSVEAADQYKKATFWAISGNVRIFFCMFMFCSFGITTTFYSTSISLHIAPLVGGVDRVGYVILIAGVAEIVVAPVVGFALDRGVSAKLTVVIGYALCAVGLLVMRPTPIIPFLRFIIPNTPYSCSAQRS